MRFSKRVTDRPPYLFHMIDQKRQEAQAKGIDVIKLDVGDPDRPTPKFIQDIMASEIRDAANHDYPSYKGEPDFLEGVARWFGKRFGASLDPKTEVMAVIGSKDAVSHLPQTFLDPGDLGIVTDPGYPVYDAAITFAGGDIYRVPLTAEKQFQADLDAVDPDAAKKAKIFYVNYPNNPTAAVAERSFFEKLVRFARENNIVILADNAYSEVYFDPADRPISIMEIDGAKETAIELHSFSKTFNMTGWRIGFVVGGKELIDAFLTLKSNYDSGVFKAVQRTAAKALASPEAEAHNEERTSLFKSRRDRIAPVLKELGFRFDVPRASYYFWVRIPDAFDSSVAFCAELLERTGLVVTPGVGFGPNGEGWFRIAMTAPDHRIDEGMERLKEFMKSL